MINYHFHTEFSSDARGALASHCAEASPGASICVTNHAEALVGDGQWQADPREMIRRFRRSAGAVRGAAEGFPELEIRHGIELEYRREWKTAFELLLQMIPFDFVLGSVHVVDGLNISGGPHVDEFFLSRSLDEAYEAYFREVAEMVEWGQFDVVAHFDLVKRYGHRHYGGYRPQRFRSLIEPILASMARKGIGLEINTSGVSQAPGVPYPEPEILEWALEIGVDVLTIGTDSHRPEDFQQGLSEGIRLAMDTGWSEFTVFERRKPTRRIDVPGRAG